MSAHLVEAYKAGHHEEVPNKCNNPCLSCRTCERHLKKYHVSCYAAHVLTLLELQKLGIIKNTV